MIRFKAWLTRHPISAVSLGLLIIFFLYFFAGWPKETPNVDYGITWSKPYAEELGLDAQEGLERALDELGVRHLRLSAYWKLLEPEQGNFDFSWLDEQLDAVAKRGGTVTLAVGSRLPRWPECWEPEWVESLSRNDRKAAQLAYLKTVYERYRDRPEITSWQVENEVAFTLYVNCPGLTRDLVHAELDYLIAEEGKRGDERRSIVTADSGELSTWLGFASKVDGKGISTYRVISNPWTGNIRYSLVPPWPYQRKAWLVQAWVPYIYVSEFQMEPWANEALTALTPEEQFVTFDPEQMEKNLWFARHMGFDRIDFWGAEWWLWMKERHGHPEFWERMRLFFADRR